MYLKLLIGAVVSAVSLSSASAITMVAGINFQDNAFADSVISSSGSYTLAGASSLAAAVTGSSLTKYAFASGASVSTASITAGFTDNYLVNGAGYDLALFEFGSKSIFSVTVLGKTIKYASAVASSTTAFGPSTTINAVYIDLSDFGAAADAQFSSILIGMGIAPSGYSLPSLSVVGALNSAPKTQSVPDAGSTAVLMSMSLLSIGLLKRKF